MCECRKIIDDKLKPMNGRLAFGFSFGSEGMELSPPMIQTEKIDKRKRKKPPIILATYCPFCGDCYEAKT